MPDLFFTDDVVEVLNLMPEQIDTMGYYVVNPNIGIRKSIVGMRFKIKVYKTLIYSNYPYPLNISIHIRGWQYGYISSKFDTSQILLKHRPAKNHLKSILYKLFRLYIP